MDERVILQELIDAGNGVLATHKPNPPNVLFFPTLDNGAFKGWRAKCEHSLQAMLGVDHVYTKSFVASVGNKAYSSAAKAGIAVLESVLDDYAKDRIAKPSHASHAIDTLHQICNRFHIVARQLRGRHGGRPAFNLVDEYDVQDLFHCLLVLFFDDVRPEEYTPSYAGKATRTDFLLKDEAVIVEIKKSRPGLNPGLFGSQLIEDIARYKSHPDCGLLVCFVYDPEGLIPNPKGLENDLRQTEPIPVHVLIRP